MNPSVKVAQPGWNANTAPDWALVFNSQWPSLQIAYETTINIAANTHITFQATHNLNYPPLTSVWITTNGVNYGRLGGYEIETTTITSFLTTTFPNPVTITVRCYNIDISKEASYPLPVGAAAPTSPDLTTGIKIVKQNPIRGISSPNLNDFILNSIAQSPAVLNVATESGQYYGVSGGKDLITYPLQTSYIPWVTGALDTSGNGTIYQVYVPTALTYSNNSIIFNITSTGAGSLIVLRDPLFYPNTVRVVY